MIAGPIVTGLAHGYKMLKTCVHASRVQGRSLLPASAYTEGGEGTQGSARRRRPGADWWNFLGERPGYLGRRPAPKAPAEGSRFFVGFSMPL